MKKLKSLAVLGLVSAAGFAQAAGVDIATETAAAKTDIQAAGALIIGVVVAVAAIGWIRRVIR